MAITIVNTTDTFEQWRQKTNQISNNLGDLSTLSNPDGTPSNSVIETITQINSTNIALIIALG